MSRLQKVIEKNERASEKKLRPRKENAKDKELPVYDLSGKYHSPEKTRRRRRAITIIVVVGGLLAFIYLPEFFMKEEVAESSDPTVALDGTAVSTNSKVLRDYPNEDFDGDGLTNSEENTYGSDPWSEDTDGDGATDYYEVNISDTSPTEANSSILNDLQTKADAQNGKSVSSPYKIGNVILWAADYDSKAHGSVVETLNGYRFCSFSGYAQFPDEVRYAYKVENGVHTLLSYRETENAWLIEGSCTVDTYSEKLTEVIDMSLLGHHTYLDPSTVTKVLAKALPDKGFITAQKKMEVDIDPDVSDSVTTDIVKPAYSSDDDFRFQADTNTLSDLNYVMDAVDDGSCVAVSLFKDGEGEYIGIVYGYTADGNLLIADTETLEPVGTLYIEERACKMVGQDEEIVSVSYFTFSGLGFDSTEGDRINFFAASNSTSGSNNLVDDGTDTEDEEGSGGGTETEEDAADTEGTDTETGGTAGISSSDSGTADADTENSDTPSGTADAGAGSFGTSSDSTGSNSTSSSSDTAGTGTASDSAAEDDEIITSSGLE